MQLFKRRDEVIVYLIFFTVIGTRYKYCYADGLRGYSCQFFLYFSDRRQQFCFIVLPAQDKALFCQQILMDIIDQKADLVLRGKIYTYNIPVILCQFEHFGISSHICIGRFFFHEKSGGNQIIHNMFHSHKTDIIFFGKDTPCRISVSYDTLQYIFRIYISDIFYRQNLFFLSRHFICDSLCFYILNIHCYCF